MDPNTFERLWKSSRFQWEAPKEQVKTCVHARCLAADIENMCEELITNPTYRSIERAIVIVVKQYYKYRSLAPKSCRNHISDRGHICLFHTYERAIETLLLLEARLPPPMTHISSLPPEPQPVLTLPSRLERALEEYTIGEILGGKVEDD